VKAFRKRWKHEHHRDFLSNEWGVDFRPAIFLHSPLLAYFALRWAKVPLKMAGTAGFFRTD
jgi:hypothetical protein